MQGFHGFLPERSRLKACIRTAPTARRVGVVHRGHGFGRGELVYFYLHAVGRKVEEDEEEEEELVLANLFVRMIIVRKKQFHPVLTSPLPYNPALSHRKHRKHWHADV
jgi:hypothetical protein